MRTTSFNQLEDNPGEVEMARSPKPATGSAPPPPPPPPDGGFEAWLQVAAGFCIFFNTWGLLNSYGAFQSFYEQGYLRGKSPSDISWIGTIQSSFIVLGAVFSGPLYDWGYLRPLILVGSFMVVFGMFMASLCTQYWQLVLAQGLLMGIGTGCLFTPTLGVIASNFGKKRGLAIGIASAGSTIAGIIYPIMFQRLAQSVGFGWAVRAIAFVILGLQLVPVFGMRMRTKPPAVRRIFDAAPWKEATFSLYVFSVFLGYTGLYVPYFYIQTYCLQENIIRGDLNFYLLPIMNVGGFFGRVALGHLADRLKPLDSFIISSGASAVLVCGWIGIKSEASVLVFCVLYGFFSAGVITVPAAVVATVLCPDIRQYGVRLTMALVPAGIGMLIGNPIAGAVLRSGWKSLQAYSLTLLVACTLFSIAARVTHMRAQSK